MSRIFELFGYRLDRWNAEAAANREKAWCPFMNAECDGGGNRHLSAIDVSRHPTLANYFPGKTTVQAGICSLRLRESEQPWIICPRRLLSLKGQQANYQAHVREQLFKYANFQPGETHRVWSEVKMKVDTTNTENEAKSFDYTFDYVIAGAARKKLSDVAEMIGKGLRATQKIAEDNQYTMAYRNGELWIDDFPADPIVIVEVMTSSTSGGNKSKRTQIAMAFEDAVVSPESHSAPIINYRQVWARMVSQLIVKSQVGIAWNGKTIWILQDLLAQYISSTTALNLSKFITEHPNEVNMLAFGYGEIDAGETTAIKELVDSTFYAGPISENAEDPAAGGFVDIVKIGAPPDKAHLWRSLFRKTPCGTIR